MALLGENVQRVGSLLGSKSVYSPQRRLLERLQRLAHGASGHPGLRGQQVSFVLGSKRILNRDRNP